MPPHPDKNQQAVRDLLEKLTAEEVRVMGIEALRRCRTTIAPDGEISMHGDFGRAMVPLLAEGTGTTIEAQNGKEAFLECQAEPWMNDVVEFIWWMIRAGFLIPRLAHDNGNLVRMRLTVAGGCFLDSKVDHPLLPGALERVRARCPGIPDEVIEYLVDAHSCLEHALARPSIVLAGLAYEAAIDKVVEVLANRGLVASRLGDQKAWKKISVVGPAIPHVFSKAEDREKSFAATAAWDFADTLRRRRNDGSHPRPVFDFSDLTEVQEFFVSALRHLPGLWSVAV